METLSMTRFLRFLRPLRALGFRPLILAVVLLGSGTALAQAPAPAPAPAAAANPDEAAMRFKRGLELYEEQDFPNALIEFRRAYELQPSYKILYNLGQVCFQLT